MLLHLCSFILVGQIDPALFTNHFMWLKLKNKSLILSLIHDATGVDYSDSITTARRLKCTKPTERDAQQPVRPTEYLSYNQQNK